MIRLVGYLVAFRRHATNECRRPLKIAIIVLQREAKLCLLMT